MASVTPLPAEALDWLTGPERASILLIGAEESYGAILAHDGHVVTIVDPDPTRLSPIAARRVWIHVVAADAGTLPFDPTCFDMVLSIQNFHTFAPGLVLGEWARVLRPGGRLGLAYLTRDESVPWVRRLKRIVQARLPEAMTSDYGFASLAALDSSPYFPDPQQISFRMWVPSTRAQLQESVRHATGADALTDDQLAGLTDEVGRLYDQYARVPEPLLLPYRIHCRRALVDQSELTASLVPGDAGLTISL